MIPFDTASLKNLFIPAATSRGEDNGQIVIIGGSSLFHGAPLLALVTASRFVDIVFFTSPEPSLSKVTEKIKSHLFSFIWMPFSEVKEYLKKSDAVLIGPGLMRYRSEKKHPGSKKINDTAGKETRRLSQKLLSLFPDKKWVIDAGSLQTMEPDWIPKNTILTPNAKEYKLLFGNLSINKAAQKYQCIIVLKGIETLVVSPQQTIVVRGGNPGLTKGGTGDVQAGLTVALLAKNEPLLAASAAAFLVKAAGDDLYQKAGVNYNADDLAAAIPATLHHFMS